MKAKEFKDEVLKHYLDEDMLVTVDKDPGKWSTGNGLLHTSLFYTILYLNDLADDYDKLRFICALDKCLVRHNDHMVYGLYNRNQARPDFQGFDDYHLVTASSLLETMHCNDVYNYGNKTHWSYNNERPYLKNFMSPHWWRGFHGRFLAMVGYYHLAADVYQGPLNTAMILCDMALGPSNSSSGIMKQFLRVQVYKYKSTKFREDVEKWGKNARHKYGSLNRALTGYFKDGHPFSKYYIDFSGRVLDV